MLSTRLLTGTVLVALTVGVLLLDQQLPPWYPCLFVLVVGLTFAAGYEICHLLDPARRPNLLVVIGGAAAVAASSWLAHVPGTSELQSQPWPWIAGTFIAAVLLVFLVEMATFAVPGRSVERMALEVWMIAYLGLLPCCLSQLRWREGPGEPGTIAVMLAIFVPKCCDTGAYLTGRLLGRHKMTPVLSPKKTYEGAAGGLACAAGMAVAIDQLSSAAPLRQKVLYEIGFGLSVGLASMLGDLAESLIKRDCGQKDASHTLPGFGGILDVVDSLIFAAPVAYLWLTVV
jgi:phosphatidate cytidylyltransferase